MNRKRIYRKYGFLLFSLIIISGNLDNSACTIFMGSSGGKVLVGNNEDFIDPNTYVWFLTNSPNKFGRVYFGYGHELPQGGMNEKGLFFDYATTQPRIGKYYKRKDVFKGSLAELAIETCSNVSEVINLFEKYDRSFMTYQIMFVDKDGNSIIIETDTIIKKIQHYQVATNFCQSLNDPNPYSIERYRCADSMLKSTNNYNIDYFRSILDCTHQEENSPTQYSNIYDLNTGDVYVYLFHDFLTFSKLNLQEELKKGNHAYKLSDLINPSPSYKKYVSEYHIPVFNIIQRDTTDYRRYAGVYEIIDFPPMKYYITSESGSLFLLMSGINKYKLYPVSRDTFILKELNLKITFEKNDQRINDKISISLYGLMNYAAKRTE